MYIPNVGGSGLRTTLDVIYGDKHEFLEVTTVEILLE